MEENEKKCMATEECFQIDFTIAGHGLHGSGHTLQLYEFLLHRMVQTIKLLIFGCQKPLVDRTMNEATTSPHKMVFHSN